ALAFPGRAHIVEDQREQILVQNTAANEFYRRYANPLLPNLATQTHRSGKSAANVGMVRAVSYIEDRLAVAFIEDRHHERDVGKMCPTLIGVVQDCYIGWFEGKRVKSGPDRHGHGAKMNRHIITHRDDSSSFVENCA